MKKINLYPNRSLIKVTFLSPFRDLRIKCIPETAAQTLKQFMSFHGYYLIDRLNLGIGDVSKDEDKAIMAVASEIFSTELVEAGILEENWPDICHYEFLPDL